MNEYDAAFSAAVGGNQAADPYDAIMAGLMPKAAPQAKAAPKFDMKPDDPGAFGAAMIGAGRTFDRIGAGLQQMYYGATGNKGAQDELAAKQAENARIFGALQQQRPLATGIGESLPAMAIPVGGASAGVVGLMGRAALGAAIPEALAYGSVGERAQRAALSGAGAAAGAGAGYAIGKGVQALGRGLPVDQQAQAAAAVLEKYGIPVRPDQATGNRTLQNLNAALDNLPITAGRQQAFREAQQEAINKAVGAGIGMPASQLDDATRIAAKQALGRTFSDLSARNTISQQASNTLVNDLSAIQAEAMRMGTSDTGRIVSNAIDDVLAKVGPNGTIEGGAYRQLDSALGKLARNNRSGDVASYVGDVRNALRSAMDSSISAADQQAWKQVRQQYANLANVSKAVDESGNVSARRLNNVLRNSSRDITKTAKGDLGELSTALKSIIPDAVPNSGTAQRLAAQALLTGGGGLAGYLYGGGDLEKAGLGAAGALALPLAARAAINNPQLIGRLAQQRYALPNAVPMASGLLGASAGYAAPGLLFPATAP